MASARHARPDDGAHVGAYLVINTVFAVIWARHRRGFLWPAYPIVGWGLGLSFQHFSAVLRGQITDEDVRRQLRPGAAEEEPHRPTAT